MDFKVSYNDVCIRCHTPFHCPEAVGNPLGDRILLKLELFENFEEIASRVGKLLVGKYEMDLEKVLFEFLVFVWSEMYFGKSDGLGCS